MSTIKTAYNDEFIRKGDEGSRLLAALAAETYGNSKQLIAQEQGMNANVFLKIPEGYHVLVHSGTADPHISDPAEYAVSLVEYLAMQARLLKATPLGFANVIDSSDGNLQLLEKIGRGMVNAANENGLVLLNGENAIMGDRVSHVNMTGTMISMIQSTQSCPIPIARQYLTKIDRFPYAEFDPSGKLVFINSDGVGTKTEFYERSERYEDALRDSLAMKLDDCVKIGARALVVMDVVETSGDIPFQRLLDESLRLGGQLDICYLIQQETLEGRIHGYKTGSPAFHIGGSAVSVIAKDAINNLPVPHEGDTVLALQKTLNPRSNGITEKRRIMRELCGEDWHRTGRGKKILRYLTMPSTIFYPAFMDLLNNHAASAVFHMSGGAIDGKLARPLAKQGLYAELSNLFDPAPEEMFLMQHSGRNIHDWYATSNMGNEAYVTTADVRQADAILDQHGIRHHPVGKLVRQERTGVEVVLEGERRMYFSGR